MIRLYAVLDRRPPASALDRHTRGLRFLACGGVVAAVRVVGRPPRLDRRALERHDRVVRGLVASGAAVLPARFGCVLPGAGALDAHLRSGAGPLRRSLGRVRGRVQMTLRVSATAAAPPAATPRSGRAYLRSRAARLRGDDVPGLAALLRALRPHTAAQRIERHEEAPLAASVYHLLDRRRLERYQAALAAASGRASAPLRVTASGPWPAYAFAPEIAL